MQHFWAKFSVKIGVGEWRVAENTISSSQGLGPKNYEFDCGGTKNMWPKAGQ